MFASTADDHTQAVLQMAGGCCVGICLEDADVLVPGRIWPGMPVKTRDLPYCRRHYALIEQSLPKPAISDFDVC